MLKAIDLFAGAGGFSCGFEKAGFKITKAVEFNSEIAKTYEYNHPYTKMIVDDIKNVDQTKEFKEKEVDVIIGGPPCQGFSMAGARNRIGFMDDPRNYLFKHYFNIVKTIKPKVFVFENVKGLLSMQKGAIFNEIRRIFSDKKLLDGDSYNLFWKIEKAVDFGIPQKRERFILIGILNKKNIDFENVFKETKKEIVKKNSEFFVQQTIRDAIGNMPLPTKDGIILEPKPKTEYEKELSVKQGTRIFNHMKSNHSIKAIARMAKIKPGENYTVLNEKIKSVHSGSYGRMEWDEPAVTITTRFDTPSGGRFIHPIENRTITPREAARIQSFPDSYRFIGSKSSISTQIGNAVPPKMAYVLARMVIKLIEQ